MSLVKCLCVRKRQRSNKCQLAPAVDAFLIFFFTSSTPRFTHPPFYREKVCGAPQRVEILTARHEDNVIGSEVQLFRPGKQGYRSQNGRRTLKREKLYFGDGVSDSASAVKWDDFFFRSGGVDFGPMAGLAPSRGRIGSCL